MDFFTEIAALIIVATIGALIARAFKQPMIPAFIVVGAILGFFVPISNKDLIWTLSEIGIAFLLFIVGLEFKFNRLKDVGRAVTFGAILQIILIFIIGIFVALLLKFQNLEMIYIGLIVVFSSTAVVVKMLSDKHQLSTLHGRIIIGILLMQDIFAILAIFILSSLTAFSVWPFLLSIIKAVAIIAGGLLLGKYIFPTLFKFAAKNQELLSLTAISVCFGFAFLFHFIHFSIVIGAFVAGLILANLPYNMEIIGRVTPLRHFFATLFFVSLGAQLKINGYWAELILPLIVLTLVVVLVKPLITLSITSLFKYTKRTSFLCSIYLAQISEFALILIVLGVSFGHVSEKLFTLVILLSMVTIIVSSYFVKFQEKLYKKFATWLRWFDVSDASAELRNIQHEEDYDVVLCGYDRIGYSILKKLQKSHQSFLVVDFNPDIVRMLIKKKIHCLYGDVSDPEILDLVSFDRTKLIISTIPDYEITMFIMKHARRQNKNIRVVVTAYSVGDALKLYDRGADYVVLPHFIGGHHVSNLVGEFTAGYEKILKHKMAHLRELKEREDLKHEHPKRDLHLR